MKKVDRLVFFDEIQRSLRLDDYHDVEDIKGDMLYMMDSMILYYDGKDKEVISRFIEYAKNVFTDCWFYHRVQDEDGFEQFLRRNQRRLKNAFWKDEMVEEIFRVFKQDCKDYAMLLPRSLRKLLPPQQAVISGTQQTGSETVQASAVSQLVQQSTSTPQPIQQSTSAPRSEERDLVPSGVGTEVIVAEPTSLLTEEVLDADLPSLIEVEQNPQQGVNDYWEFFCHIHSILMTRARRCCEVGLTTYAESHERAVKVFTKVFASKVKNTVFSNQQQQFRKEYLTLTTRMDKRPVHRPSGNLVSYLTPDQKFVYDTPAL